VRPRVHLPGALAIGALVRAPFWVEALRTPLDADTAIVGLMARHLGQGATLWGQPYGSPLDAYLVAPWFAVLGQGPDALRFSYFFLGLALIPIAYFLAGALHPRAALPAAVLMACPTPYLVLLSALPPPLYPTTLVLCGLLSWLALRIGKRLDAAEPPPRIALVLWGALAGLALWTHLMAASIVAATAAFLWFRARGRRAVLLWALIPCLVLSAPWWLEVFRGSWATRIVAVSNRDVGTREHLREMLPRLHRPIAGLLGAHTPLIADDPERVLWSSPWAAGAILVLYAGALAVAARASRESAAARLLLACLALVVVAFPFPLRSGPHTIRFLTPAYLPLVALVTWAPLAFSRVETQGARRAWLLVLALAALHAQADIRLLGSWRSLDRAEAPFLLADLAPVRRILENHNVRRAYASYETAYRLTFETGERIVVSEPWNERFRHYPLPYLDEVRFSKNVAWILASHPSSDMPSARAFEDALGAIGGSWRRIDTGAATVYTDFVPPFSPYVEPLAGAGKAGDGDVGTQELPDRAAPVTFELPSPQALDGVTLIAGKREPRLLRSMDVEVSRDGTVFEVVARRRRRQERMDLRWVNGHPQYVLDNDLIAIALDGRSIAAIRISPYSSTEAWSLAEVLLHPAEEMERRGPWGEWLDPNLSWARRRKALAATPLKDREDWYYRVLVADRNR